MHFLLGAALLFSFTRGQASLNTFAPECFNECVDRLTAGDDVANVRQLYSDTIRQRMLFNCLAASCEPDLYGSALSSALRACSELEVNIAPLRPVENSPADLSPRDLAPASPGVVTYGPTAEEDLQVLNLDRDFIVAVGCSLGPDSAQTLPPQPKGCSECCACGCDPTSTSTSAVDIDYTTSENTPSEMTLWPPPCADSTASTASSSYETTMTTTEQGTVTQTSVTFVRADPPSGWVPCSPTSTTDTNILPTEITLWPPPAPAATVTTKILRNKAANKDRDLVTLIAPDGAGGTREVVIAVPRIDLPWESMIPDILLKDSSYSEANERRDLHAPQDDKLNIVAVATHWKSERPANTTLTLKMDSVVVAASAHHITSTCALAAICVVLMVLELFF